MIPSARSNQRADVLHRLLRLQALFYRNHRSEVDTRFDKCQRDFPGLLANDRRATHVGRICAGDQFHRHVWSPPVQRLRWPKLHYDGLFGIHVEDEFTTMSLPLPFDCIVDPLARNYLLVVGETTSNHDVISELKAIHSTLRSTCVRYRRLLATSLVFAILACTLRAEETRRLSSRSGLDGRQRIQNARSKPGSTA